MGRQQVGSVTPELDIGDSGRAGLWRRLERFPGLDSGLGALAGVPESVGLVAGLDDVAMVGEPVQQSRGHLGVGKNAGPFAKDQVGRDDHAGVLVKLGQQVKQQRPAGLRERQIAKLIEDDQIQVHQLVSQLTGLAGGFLPLQRVGEFDGGVETDALAVLRDGGDTQRRGQMGLTGAGATDQHDVLGLVGETERGKTLDLPTIDFGLIEVKAGQITVDREFGRSHLVRRGADSPVGGFGGDQFLQQPFGGLQRGVAAVLAPLAVTLGHAVQPQTLESGGDLSHGPPPYAGCRSDGRRRPAPR